MAKSTLNKILDARAAIVVTLNGKNRGAAADAVAAVNYQGSDRNFIEAMYDVSGYTPPFTFHGSDDVALAVLVGAVGLLPTVP